MKIISAEQVMFVEGGHYYHIGRKTDGNGSIIISIKRDYRNGEMSSIPTIVITLEDGSVITSDASHFIITEIPEKEEDNVPI